MSCLCLALLLTSLVLLLGRYLAGRTVVQPSSSCGLLSNRTLAIAHVSVVIFFFLFSFNAERYAPTVLHWWHTLNHICKCKSTITSTVIT
ncbi:hypothetical protein DER45DRAFT_546593 [Fusarium avenaceum]|nr:hypothetical protein DER45DRAFT_546593 [Fusarium avenaceum]